MNVNGISSIQRMPYGAYGRIASGKKVRTAADNAAAMSIIQKQNEQIRGYRAGSGNIKSGQLMTNIADGAVGSITDSLQRMRELALQASNTAVVTDSDRANIQKEIDQLKQGIGDIARTTNYNTKPLLDGTNQNMQIATDANGSNRPVSGTNATLESLGIADFDVTKDFDLNVLDVALAKVSESRSEMGAQYNALGSTFRNNAVAYVNSTAGKSRLEDLDIGEAISELKKNQLLQDYTTYMQKKKAEEEQKRTRGLFMLNIH